MTSTASMLVDPAAPPTNAGGAPRTQDPSEAQANCAHTSAPVDWVPDRETRLVPDLLAALCRHCPLRQACLRRALTGHEHGYWAGTTSNDRETMRRLGMDDIDTADWLQDMARHDLTDGALHAPGEGSYFWYRRRGCRCGECKSANAKVRSLERARSTQRAGVNLKAGVAERYRRRVSLHDPAPLPM